MFLRHVRLLVVVRRLRRLGSRRCRRHGRCGRDGSRDCGRGRDRGPCRGRLRCRCLRRCGLGGTSGRGSTTALVAARDGENRVVSKRPRVSNVGRLRRELADDVHGQMPILAPARVDPTRCVGIGLAGRPCDGHADRRRTAVRVEDPQHVPRRPRRTCIKSLLAVPTESALASALDSVDNLDDLDAVLVACRR